MVDLLAASKHGIRLEDIEYRKNSNRGEMC